MVGKSFWVGAMSFLMLALASWSSGCGDPDYCNNDTDCKDGKVCWRQKCQVKPASDGGDEPKDEASTPDSGKKPEPAQPDDPAKPEPRPEPRVGPEPEPKPNGTRKPGDFCDPRPFAYAHDRCEPGYACAEFEQVQPQSGAPQPNGLCIKGCSATDKTCPAGTKCIETLHTGTRQPTGVYVCAQEVDEGQTCVNTETCKDGLTCVRFGTSGTNWRCFKDCTADESACSSGSKCVKAEDDKPTKVCKKVQSEGAVCGDVVTCDDKSICFEGNRFGAFFQRCRKKCSAASDCGTNQSCFQLSRNGAPIGGACLDVAKVGESCNNGRGCSSDSLCLDLHQTHASCFKTCTSAAQCPSGFVCNRYSNNSQTMVCRPRLSPGQLPLNLGVCSNNSRSVNLSIGNMCYPTCTRGSGTAPELCGRLMPGTLRGLLFHKGLKLATVGDYGYFASSVNNGFTWGRDRIPSKADLHGIVASGDEKVLLIVGSLGTILRSEDEGKTWAAVDSKVDVGLFGVTLSHDGTLAVAVGEKGTIVRSEDGGKTWAVVAVLPAVSVNLHSVSFGRDGQGATGAPIAVAVGAKGVLLRSEDGGKTWKAISGITTSDLHAVALQRAISTTGFTGLVVGAKGEIWGSADDGKTWKQETSNVTADLRGVYLAGDVAGVVGDAGTILTHDSSAWTKATSGTTNNLSALAVSGMNWVASGNLGYVVFSTDAGKKWNALSSNLMQCVGLTSGGQSSGGICLFKCEPLKQGADCPAELTSCSPVRIGSQTVNICRPGAAALGTAKAGDACTTYAGAPDNMRCAKDHQCRFVGGGLFCIRICSATLKCETGETCVRSGTLLGDFCSKKVAKKGEECDFSQGIFCEAGSRCDFDQYTGKRICGGKVTIVGANETCDNVIRQCSGDLLCIGSTVTPYRRTCGKRCVPNQNPSKCDPGFQCLATSATEGLCVERCNGTDHVCKAKHLRCRRIVSTTSDAHCY